MKLSPWFLLLGLLAPRIVEAQSCSTGTCIPQDDLHAFVTLAKEAKCRQENAPVLAMDPIVIVTDTSGRVYGSGADPKPYTVHLNWCNYVIDAKGQVLIVSAQRPTPTWGWRFRPKATVGYLPLTAIDKKDAYAGLDAGVLLEPFFYSWFNVNAYVGFRSVGAGVGFDLTKNMGAYVGYAITWGGWQSNPHAGLSFALWLRVCGRGLVATPYRS